MNRREALGLLLLGGLIAAGRLVRRWLLTGPDGAWRDPMFLSDLMPLPPAEPEPPAPPEPPFLVNRAGIDTLVHLPGVGPVLAERIVASRRDAGPFRSADDLRRVKGIGPKLSRRLAPLLRFDAAGRDPAGTSSSPGDTCR